MRNSENYLNLRSALDDLPRISRKVKAGGLDQNDPKFNHHFSKENGLKLKSVHPGHVEAEQTTEAKHRNDRNTVHGGLLTTAADAVMAAVAQSTVGKKEKDEVAVVRDFAYRFHEPVLPGDELTVVSEIDGSTETSSGSKIKFISSEVRKGYGDDARVVGQALSSYFIVNKDDYLSGAA